MTNNEQPEVNSIGINDLRKEEYVQAHLQYRWLDETRSKLIDRVFIIAAALLLTRLQFHEKFAGNPMWLFMLESTFIFTTGSFAYSIVRYRRQQRGHMAYINVCRESLLKQCNNMENYSDYIKGKKIYITLGVETAVVLMAMLAPLSLLIDRNIIKPLVESFCRFNCLVFILFALFVMEIFLIFIPYWKYNFKKEIDWSKE